MQPDIKKMDLPELKSLAYDQLRILEQVRLNLDAINLEISLKEKEPKAKK